MKIKNLNFGTILLGLAALVNLARWVGIYTFSANAPAWVREIIPILDAISGLFTGLTIAGGLAFVAHRLGGLQPFTPKGRPVMRFWGAAVSGITILVLSAFLLPPYVRMTMPNELRAEIPNLKIWSVMAVLVGDLIIVAIALADSKSAGFTRSADERPKSKSLSEGSGIARGRSAKRSKLQANIPCRYAGAGCTRSGSQNAMNAHAKNCPFKPTTVVLDESLLIKKLEREK
jgi:hypothetical protein